MTSTSVPSKLDSVHIDTKNGDLIKRYKLDEKTTVSKIIDNNFIRSGAGTEYAQGHFAIKDIYTKGQEAVKICDIKPSGDMCCYVKLEVLAVNLTDMSGCQYVTSKYFIKCINSKVVIHRLSNKINFTDGGINAGVSVYINDNCITFAVIGIEGVVLKWDARLNQMQNNFTFEPNFAQPSVETSPNTPQPIESEPYVTEIDDDSTGLNDVNTLSSQRAERIESI